MPVDAVPVDAVPVDGVPVDAVVARLRAAGCVFAEDEARLLVAAARSATELAALVARRVSGTPLEHVVGWAELCSLRVEVGPGVFVPRQRTALLVAETLALLAERHGRRAGGPPTAPPLVVDLCCGSGAVGAAVLAGAPGTTLWAADVDPAAVRFARRNLEPRGGHVVEGDLYAPLPGTLRHRVDVLVANAPYVPTDAIALLPPEARAHEAAVALDGGPDGLDVVRRVVAGAPGWLAPGGHVVVETSARQASAVVDALERCGLLPRIAASDELEATAVVGRRPHR